MRNVGKVAKRRGARLLVTAALIAALFLASSVTAMAEETQNGVDVYGEIDQIIEDFADALPEDHADVTDAQGVVESLGIKRVLRDVLGEITGRSGEIVGLLLTIIGVSLIGSLASLSDGEMGRFSSRAIGCVCAALLFDRLAQLVVDAARSLEEIGELFAAVIPVCLAVNSLGVSPTTATAQAVGMGVTLSIYSCLSSYAVLPLVTAVFVTSAASSVDETFGRIAKGIRSTFLWVMGILTALIGATFSLQSIVAASADSVALRGAKYAVGSAIPIVGGTVSGALGVLTSGVAYARGVVGGGAIAVMLSVILSPLVTLLLYRICLKAGAAFSSLTSSDGASVILSSFLGALDVLIAAYTLTAAVYLVELIAFLKGGVLSA